MDQCRILIVDSHGLARKGIQMLLNSDPSVQVVGEAKDAQDAVHKAKLLQPDIILMDLMASPKHGAETIVEIKRCIPSIKVIVVTAFDDEGRINAALEAEANGYLLKEDTDSDALLRAIGAAQEGGLPLHPRVARYLVRGMAIARLTEREREVLQMVARGLSNRAVAQALGIREGTVKAHVSNILGKLNVSSRTEAAVWAVQAGLVSPDGNAAVRA
jgi:NarL family two-component system response regulator LiaR